MRRHPFAPTLAALVALGALAGCSDSHAIPGLDSPLSSTKSRTTPGPSETSTPAADTSSTGAVSTVTIGATGSVVVDAAVRGSAEKAAGAAGQYDFTPMFAPVKTYLRGSGVAICHLDTPLSQDNIDLSVAGSTTYNAPRQVATGLVWAGFTGCDTASEHAMDLGLDGLASTFRVFAHEGLAYAGPGAAQSNGRRVGISKDGAVTVADLAYSYSLDGKTTDGSAPSSARWLRRSLYPGVKAEGIIADAAAAKEAGADFVVVSLHWGEDAAANPTQEQTDLAKALLADASIDLILGTHPRHVQPCQKIGGKYVFYSLGELLADPAQGTDAAAAGTSGLVARITLARAPQGGVASSAAVLPTRVDAGGQVIEPVTKDLDAKANKAAMDTLGLLGDCPVTPLS